MASYDVIGDIHGHADELKTLLVRLGYDQHGRGYRHSERKVVFVGDFVDRGPAVGDAAAITRVIDQTRADADTIDDRLQQMQTQQHKENQGIAMSATVTEDDLIQQIEAQKDRNEQVSQQVTAVERQIKDAELRYQGDQLAADAEVRKIEAENQRLQTMLADINARKEQLAGNESPLYNGKLSDGRALVIVRLGEHPSRATYLSMREGDREVNRQFGDVDELISAVKQRDARKSHYMVLVAPGGAKDFKILQEYFDSTQGSSSFGSVQLANSIRYGFDVIGSDADFQLMFELDKP